MHPVFIELGPLSISSYGVMNALAYFACIGYLIYYRKRINIEKNMLWDILFVIAVGAILGGKLWYLIVERPSLGATFGEQLKNFFLNFRYGFAFFGGFLLAVTGMIVFMKKKGLPILKTSDFLIVSLPLGHAIGRIGCFLVGCCHGREWHSHLAVTFTNPNSLVEPALLGVPLYPVQLWETGANLIIFLILHFAYNKHKHNGAMLCGYMAMYGISRFILEFFRGDYRGGYFLNISPSQVVGLGIAAVAAALYFFVVRKGIYDDK